jgi:hypothetical protein
VVVIERIGYEGFRRRVILPGVTAVQVLWGRLYPTPLRRGWMLRVGTTGTVRERVH